MCSRRQRWPDEIALSTFHFLPAAAALDSGKSTPFEWEVDKMLRSEVTEKLLLTSHSSHYEPQFVRDKEFGVGRNFEEPKLRVPVPLQSVLR